MVYDGTNNSELIVFHAMNNSDDKHFIELYKPMDSQVLTVGCCCDRNWEYKFYITSNSDYERIKFNIMEAVLECDDVDELLDALSEIFENGFADIIVYEDENRCCEDCNVTYIDNNNNNKYLN